MADQTARLEAATVRAEVGSSILYRFSNDGVSEDPIPTASGDITNLKKVILDIQTEGANKISFATQIYATTAAGIAATSNGAIFLVRSSDPDEIYAVYSNNAGTAVDTGKRALSAAAVQAATDSATAAAAAAQAAATTATARVAGLHSPAASDPATRDDGTALQIGDTYFNTALQAGKIFSSSGWILASVSGAQLDTAIGTREPAIAPGTAGQYWSGLKTFLPLNKAAVGLPLVDNTSDAGKPISTATQTALNLKTNSATLAGSGGAGLVGYQLGATDSVARSIDSKLSEVISPMDFGAVGDGVTDDGLAWERTINYVRARINAAAGFNTIIQVDGGGKTYRTNRSINMTKLRAGWKIKNCTVVGYCTGKAIFDAIGSRDGAWEQVMILGDKTNMPSCGIQCARALDNNFGFCDGISYFDVRIRGYYSTAAIYAYGQEGTVYLHCKFWNSNPNAHVAMFQGYDRYKVTSDYLAPMTGSTSYINVKWINTDFMYLPEGNQVAITGITKANGPTITAPGHPFVNGDAVNVGYVSGMTQINNLVGVVASATTNSFVITGINSTSFSTYTSGGSVTKSQATPTVYWCRGQQHEFDCSYMVNYGSDHIEIDFPDGQPLDQVKFRVLFEGSGTRSTMRFTSAGTITDFELSTYNLHSRDSLISTSITSGFVALTGAKIVVASVVSIPVQQVLSDYNRFALYNADVRYGGSISFSPLLMQDRLNGTVYSYSAGTTIEYGVSQKSYRDLTSSPVGIASAGGALGTSSATVTCRYVGSLVYWLVEGIITAVGSGTGGINFTLPFTPAAVATGGGKEVSVNGKEVVGVMSPGNPVLSILNSDGTSAIVAGGNYKVSGFAILA